MKRSNISVMARLFKIATPLIGIMLIAVTTGVAGFLCAIFITIFGGYALLDVLEISTGLSLSAIFVSVLIFAVLRGALRYIEQASNHYIAFKLLAILRDKVFKSLRRLAPSKLEGKDKGNLISIITSDIELLEVFYAHTISPIVIAAIMTVIMSAFIGNFHWILGLVALSVYIIIGVVIPVITSKKLRSDGETFRKQFGELNSLVLDNIRGISESIQYGVGDKKLKEINNANDKISEKSMKIKYSSYKTTMLINTAILFFGAAMLFVSSYLFINNKVAFDGVLIPTIALMSSFGPVIALANLGSGLTQTLAAGNRVLDILDESPVVRDVVNGENVEFNGATMNKVNFSYANEKILSDFNIDIKKNRILGIVGKSGSGKSTMLKLLMRFWDVQSGSVIISEKSIKEINTDCLRNIESYVTQETVLFHDSIKNNLLIADRSASDDEIHEACKKASIHDFIMSLPSQYETNIGELGNTLSGGERQRLGLARAFLHKSPFILLDEPTSNLDSLNEAIILKSLYNQKTDKTVVLVSHRMSTMNIADNIFKVDNGRVS